MITSSKLFSFVDKFKVLDKNDFDHFPISCSIRLEKRHIIILLNQHMI